MPVVPRRTSSSRFIGRAEQIGLFDDVLGEMLSGVDGSGHVLLVGGEAGVGKSRLVDEWAARGRAAGALVLRGWCIEHGDDVMPLAPIGDILRDAAVQAGRLPQDEIGPEADDLARLVPVFDRPAAPLAGHTAPSLSALADGLLRVLYGLSASRPLIVVVEDLHWSDASTRQLLMFLGPRIGSRRIVLSGTYRTDELHRRHPLRPFLGSWQRAARPIKVDLAPFSRDEVGELVSSFTGKAPESAVVDQLFRRCAGNAFFAEELLAGDDKGRPSMLLRDAVLARTQGLGENALTILRMASAAGQRISTAVLSGACGLDARDFAAAVEDLVAAGLCVQGGETVGFRHELAREIIEDEVLAVDRRGLHAALASTMQAIAPDRRGEIARHWFLAGERVSALTASVVAARAAADVGADTEAFTQFQRALELWDLVPDAEEFAGCDHATLLLDAADAAGRARLFRQAIELGRRGVTEAGSSGAEAQACLRLIPWTWFGVDDDETSRLIDRAAQAVEDPPGIRTALTLAWRATLTLSEWRHDRPGADLARSIAQRALDLAREAGSAQAEAHARLTLGVCTCIAGNPEGLNDIRAALVTAKAGGFTMEAGRAYDNLAYYLSEFWRHDEVIDLEPEAMDYCAAAGINRVQGTMVQLRVIRALQLRGRWSDVERRVEDLRAEFGSLDIEHLTLADSWGLIRVRQGRLDHVQELVDAAFAVMVSHESVIGPTTVVAIELQAARGTATEIPSLVDSALARILPRFAEHAAEVAAAAIRALADCLDWGATWTGADRPTLRRMTGGWLDRVKQADPPPIPPWIVIAEAEHARLNSEPAEEPWRRAVAAWRDLGSPYELAYTEFRLCEVLLSGPDRQSATTRTEARTRLIEARAAADRLAALPLRDRIDALATRAHLSLETLPTRGGIPTGDDQLGLTDREREVLRLVAAGYSNGQIGQALFISRKTASVHVSNILRKLGVSSRVEAATRSVRAETD
jgi:DNA-binding CsgD family transcriptional regulator